MYRGREMKSSFASFSPDSDGTQQLVWHWWNLFERKNCRWDSRQFGLSTTVNISLNVVIRKLFEFNKYGILKLLYWFDFTRSLHYRNVFGLYIWDTFLSDDLLGCCLGFYGTKRFVTLFLISLSYSDGTSFWHLFFLLEKPRNRYCRLQAG